MTRPLKKGHQETAALTGLECLYTVSRMAKPSSRHNEMREITAARLLDSAEYKEALVGISPSVVKVTACQPTA